MARKINQYKTTYYKEIGALITIIFISFLVYCQSRQEVVEEPQTLTTMQLLQVREPVEHKELSNEEYIIEKIRSYFPRNADVMVAIAYAESGMKQEAQGFNCYYNKEETIVYTTKVKGSHSTHCKVKDRSFAYSTDCFILQRNYKGQVCPKGITLEQHLQEVADLSRKQGLSAWSAYNNKSYQRYLSAN